MGDLGTYIPIVMALTLASDLNLGTTLIFTGMYNIVTGAIYGVPMPVQPMKSIAAVAISNKEEFGIPEVMAAGICTGGILLILGCTGKDFSATSLSVTVGLMNLVGCWFGAMPCCHGAGGLAGQYKFGGRSGVGVLGVLLLFAGIELAMASRDMNTKDESFVMLICTAVSLVGSSAALGFVCGIVAHVLLKLRSGIMHSTRIP
ncbi:hypothetical protein GH714_032872 [Hevea brasiliensis]|uniref:SLC26A/SulP transporter domain-containing protein n=1 Tax=Hevea brasiliensis TaxID=3981 RepID=A0A6A6LVJ6_HEVBR|nr:hypothetical protein GH714_032872 [Hevea brasiliensis]